MRRPTQPPRRLGFTLVELMVVMVVLGVLIGLLVPAIGAAVKAARAAQVTAEINNIATALAQFKSNYSDYPPSRIVLNESGNYNTTSTTTITSLAAYSSGIQADITTGQLSQRSVRYLSKFFPRALCFSTTGTGTKVDINGDGAATSTFYLDGGECLVLFLGGMTTTPTAAAGGPANTPIGMNGFSRSPANPFDRTSTSRTQPLYEFKGDRLVDVDGDGFPSYNDAVSTGVQGRAYAYFSAYGGNSYDPNDCNIPASATLDPLGHSLNDKFSRTFLVNFSVDTTGGYNSCFNSPSSVCVSPSPNPYTTTAAVPGTGATNWQNPQSFQIISAGADQIFGVGGQFAGNNTTNRLAVPTSELVAGPPEKWAGGVCSGQTDIDDRRNTESDNLSNFVSTRLNQ